MDLMHSFALVSFINWKSNLFLPKNLNFEDHQRIINKVFSYFVNFAVGIVINSLFRLQLRCAFRPL